MGYLEKSLEGILSREEIDLLPRGFERIGHVAIMTIPEEIRHKSDLIANALLKIKGVETVARRAGPIEGRERRPKLEVLAGNPSTETTHRENGCVFRLDVSEVMFSAGNMHERQRIPKLVKAGETVVDFFAGVGQFSIPIAKLSRPRKVHSIEINPVAHRYLCENVRVNKVGHIVSPFLGDCEKVAPPGVADRVVMGIVHVGQKYLPLAVRTLRPEGGVIHYHESVPSTVGFRRPVERITKAAGGRDVEIIEKRAVKRYAPGVDHVVVDARVGPA